MLFKKLIGMRAAIAAAALSLIATPALAHHSFAMFDQTKEQTLKGKIKEFQWVNPHGWIQIIVVEAGKPVEYSLEMGGVAGLVRQGFKKTTLKPGDEVTVTIHPLKDGAKGGEFMRVTLADGTTLGRPLRE